MVRVAAVVYKARRDGGPHGAISGIERAPGTAIAAPPMYKRTAPQVAPSNGL
jgi:hypothetical protein